MSPKKKLPAKKCRATNRQGKQCGRWAIPGGTVCNLHGGKTPAVQRAAARRYREQQIQAELERHKELTTTALTGVTNPLDELQRLTTEARFFMDSLKTRVNELKTIKTYNDIGVEQASVEIDLYLKSMDRLTKLLDIALKHDIEGRKLALDQAKADMVAGLIIRTLAHAGLTGDRMEEAKAYMLTEIQKLEAEEKQ